MSEPFLGQICMFGFPFAPAYWATCDGQIINIDQNSALYALLGVTYGGNGTSNFALPDLRGRVPIHQGNGTGLTPRTIGNFDGKEKHKLVANEIPSHTHTVVPKGVDATGTALSPTNAVFAKPGSGRAIYEVNNVATTVNMASLQTTPVGGSVEHNNMQPYLVVNFCIALSGIFPTRD